MSEDIQKIINALQNDKKIPNTKNDGLKTSERSADSAGLKTVNFSDEGLKTLTENKDD